MSLLLLFKDLHFFGVGGKGKTQTSAVYLPTPSPKQIPSSKPSSKTLPPQTVSAKAKPPQPSIAKTMPITDPILEALGRERELGENLARLQKKISDTAERVALAKQNWRKAQMLKELKRREARRLAELEAHRLYLQQLEDEFLLVLAL